MIFPPVGANRRSPLHRNPFARPLASLTHPITLGAAALMLANDHILRQVAPSWITGKLSDAAWLVIVPPLVALVLAWILPRRECICPLALTLTGAAFALLKL